VSEDIEDGNSSHSSEEELESVAESQPTLLDEQFGAQKKLWTLNKIKEKLTVVNPFRRKRKKSSRPNFIDFTALETPRQESGDLVFDRVISSIYA
jgi:hypothetical protein